MEARRGAGQRQAGIRGEGGYSLIEMSVAVVMVGFIAAGLYFVFTSQQRSWRSQKTYNDLQTNCTFAMDTIKNDLLLAGYKAKNGVEPISGAAANAITFEFYDDNASVDPPYDDVNQFTNHTQVSYSLSGTDLVKTVKRWHTPGAGQYDTPTSFVLAQNVPVLGFEYFKEDNAAWSTAEGKDLIRTVRVTLQCNAGQANALNAVVRDSNIQAINLTAEVRPRNIAVSENPEDKTPPRPPLSQVGASMKVWDEGQCGCLQLRWTSNTDSDIAGYTIYYGLASGSYVGRARAVHQPGADQYFTLRNLAAANVPYFIAIAAYDKSGNQSANSAEVSADPGTSVRAESEPGDDTAVTPLPPPAPGAPSVATPADNQLQVSWTPTYSDCLHPPNFGYRIYRSTNPNFVPEGASAGFGNCIADESTLGATATGYLDTGADTPQGFLVGCATYHYKIAVVTCDATQLTAYTDGDAATSTTYTAAQFASVSGTPTDGTRPGIATGTPILTSKPGYRRIILSLTNPSRALGQDPDFLHTRVYFSTTPPGPQMTATRDAQGYNVVANGQLIPDRGGQIPEGGGPHTVNFDDEVNEVPPGGLGDPQLQPDQTYYFLAIAYDLCKNPSLETEQARSTAEQCADCLVGETCRDAPPMASNVRVTQGCDGAPLRLDWDFADANYITHPDFQGFRVVRCEGAGCVPGDPIVGGTGTVLGGTYLSPDKYLMDDSVVDGRLYNYRVYAGDCYYQRWLEGLLSGDDLADNPPANNAASTDISGLALGFLDRAHVTGDRETTLAAAITDTDTTIPVASTVGWTHRRLQINTEVVECNGVTPTSFTDCWRGAEATIPISHFAGTPVRSFPPAPPRAAVTGDLSVVPPTFLHDSVVVGARNVSAGSITLNQVYAAWEDPGAWLTALLYDESVTMFQQTAPYTHGASGSEVPLTPVIVPALANNVPLKMSFLKSDGTSDPTIDLREDRLHLIWRYRNNTTGIETCSREWRPPAPAGIVGPAGPAIMGTTQSAPTWGTVAWPVPGLASNPLNAVVAPSNAWNFVMTNVRDSSLTGIASVRLYYTTTDPTTTVAPPVGGAYPGCAPYTMVEMFNWGGTDIWSASFPQWPALPAELNGRNVWYFIVAVDNEGNFDREPEVGQGAYQYYQQPEDPCLNTPRAPEVTVSVDGSSVTLDWSASWLGMPERYYNTNWTFCNDLAGFRVFRQVGLGAATTEVAGSPFSPTTKTFTDAFTPSVTSLTWDVPAGLASPLALSVANPAGFRIPGKVKVDNEVFRCVASDPWHLTGCTRAQDGTTAANHAVGAAVTQDLLALEAVSYFVRAFDTCPTGAKYSDSPLFTEGFCAPLCNLQVWPSGTSIRPGDSFWVDLQACGMAGNGMTDTIYVHTCGAVEGDELPLTESADSGWFSAGVATQLGATAGGGQTTLIVAAEDTIRIGGFATAPNVWGNVNDCSAYTYSCGPAKTLTVHTPGPDVCMDDHTPAAPTGLVATAVGSCSGAGTSQAQLSWSQVSTPADCTRLFYRGYSCEGSACTPNTAINGFFANCSGTTCTSNAFSIAPSKFNNKAFRFAVTAVCEINTCPTDPATRTWEGVASGVVGDPCP